MRNCSSVVSIDGFKLLEYVGALPQEYVQLILGENTTAQYGILVTGKSPHDQIWTRLITFSGL